MRSRRRTLRLPVVLTATAAAYATLDTVALGLFTSTASGAQQVATATLDPASAPGTAPGTCTPDVADSIALSWTATPSTWADGYEVLRAPAEAGPYTVVATVTGRTTTSYDDTGLAFDTTYHYQVRATKAAWHSTGTVSVNRTTRTSLCA